MYHTSKCVVDVFVRLYIIMYNVSASQFEPSHSMVLHYYYVLYVNTIWVINSNNNCIVLCATRIIYKLKDYRSQ